MKGPPSGKSPQECCQVPDIIPQNVFEKCEASNPKPAMPAPGSPPKGSIIDTLSKASKVKFLCLIKAAV